MKPDQIRSDAKVETLNGNGINGLQISQPKTRFPLLQLPNEILVEIFSFLDLDSPLEISLNQQPKAKTVGTSEDRPVLKQISLVSHRLRELVLPCLFKHVCLDPYYLRAFLEFTKQNKLDRQITSIIAYLQGPCSHVHPAWWVKLLNQVATLSFTVLCAPHVFAELAGVSINCNDSWAFNMPHQILRLEQTAEAACQDIPLDKPSNIFVARPWFSLTVNEGSSLKAYTTYEYFLRKTPSMLANLLHSRSADADNMFASLSEFSFVAIFPFYNHVDEVLKCVRKMKQLKRLSIKLCPEPDSTVLSDEIEEAQGHIDVNDPWNEFDTSNTLIAHTVIFLTVEGCLKDLHMDDVKMKGIRQNLEDTMTSRLQQWWFYRGEGDWQKRITAATTS